ncbi:leucyl aminopeptidase family protein [Roseomonas nepalensis]|uniref:Leucyl aminopeptidase family protein n=1 Tax=Muricoccus nepalensis TaxID=1854500 RepID=A0A502G877_9PROT|nr:leucyl aminopeptidase family protein [Roseomonas nepalensis]TPG58099.1 leucyl aminopeptidase family protein [Roseomonas nepalensis]
MLRLRLTELPRGRHPLAFPALPEEALPAAYAPLAAVARFGAAEGEVLRLDGALGRRTAWLVGGGAPRPLRMEVAGALAVEALSGDPEDREARPVRRAVIDARGLDPVAIGQLAMGAGMRGHRLPDLSTRPRRALRRLDLLVDDAAAAAPELARVEAVLRGVGLARDLAAEPANRLTPTSFAERLLGLRKHGVEVVVHGQDWLERHGYGALLAVGQGSARPPRLVVLRWPGSGGGAPVAFVGKGITFDTGGISIKPAKGMEAMKGDMAGAAACAGAILALALRRSPAPAVAVLAIAENATGAASYRPGDVLRTASGRTVEVVDTDAEGRLVLADALHHARGLGPSAIIDLATLTGSIVSALGHHRAGLFGNDDGLRDAAMAAGDAVGEPLWPMPIGAKHRSDLDSAIADLRHCLPVGGGGPGWVGKFLPDACQAAAFLREFAGGDTPWAHLDIAGMDLREEGVEGGAYPLPPGPSGFGVRLLDRLVADRFET